MRTCIFGSGAVGTVLGAFITQSGAQADLVSADAAHVAALKSGGAVVTGRARMRVPVKALTPGEMTGKYDLIILLTKQTANEKTLEFLKPYMAGGCAVCTMQRGLPETNVASRVGESATMGLAASWSARPAAPGCAELIGDKSSMRFTLGRVSGVKDARLYDVKKLLETMCPTDITDDIMSVRRSHLMIDAGLSGIAAVTGLTFGEIVKKPIRAFVRDAMKECFDAFSADGSSFEKIGGKDARSFTEGVGSFSRISGLVSKLRTERGLFAKDAAAGRLSEVDFINGAVCEKGDAVRVDTPVNDFILKTIHAIERGEMKPDAGNLRLFG